MIKEKELKIVHCNIDSCADRGNADRLLKEVLEQKADIIVFTEYTNTLRLDFENILKEKYPHIYIDDSNYNGIAMFISSEFVGEEIKVKWEEGFRPDTFCVDIEGNAIKTRIAGVRFQLLNQANTYEIINFLSFVNNYKPNIVIGDFNWFSVFKKGNYLLKAIELLNGETFDESYQELQKNMSKLNIVVEKRGRLQLQYQPVDDLEQKLCDIINGLVDVNNSNFYMWPSDKLNIGSFITKGKGAKISGVTSPDRIIYDSNIIDECKADYYPHIDMETEFPSEWKTDHAMMVATLTYK